MKKAPDRPEMVKKYCTTCQEDRWHNQLKRPKATDAPTYRCVGCGFPKRFGSKNYALRVNGKLAFVPMGG